MPSCNVCGERVDLPYDCKGCSGTYCSEHRLPENHDCAGLADWGDPDGVFDSGFDDGVEDDTGLTDRLDIDLGVGTGRTGLRGYVRGNMTFVFLGLMAVTFMFQQVVLRLLPAFVGGERALELHQALFVLSPANPEYVWTWVTSIFAHDPTGLFHLLGNGIVVYFFGQSVERYVGSKEFSALFLGAGVAAGLAQVAVQAFYVGDPTTGGVLGASGAALAVLGTMTVFNPNARVMLLVPPVPVPLWLITGGYALVSIAFLGGGGGQFGLGGIAHAAHLVGLLVGLTYGQLVKDRVSMPRQLQLGGGRRGGPGGPGGPGPGGGRGPF